MKDFLDRQPTKAGRRLLTHEDGTTEYVTVAMADEPTEEGTPLNRATFMALQGIEGMKITFNSDGSIAETNDKNEIMTTIFNADGSITERFVNSNGLTISKTTIFNADGSITERVSE